MKRILEVALGIVTSIGGFLEVGSIATAAQGGAAFGYQLGWAIAFGTIALAFLVEMSGRLAAVSHHTLMDAVRERFGFDFFTIPLTAIVLVSFLTMTAEIGGVCLALQLGTGVAARWWAPLVALLVWLLVWKGTFGVVEKGVALLGLITVVFVVAAVRLAPDWSGVTRGLLPSLPTHDPASYWFIAVSILGASLTPYLFVFYSSGAIEDRWDVSYLGINRVTAWMGMSFGGLLSLAILVAAALVYHPLGIRIGEYDQMGVLLTTTLGRWGFYLFAAALGIACFGAAAEIALSCAYAVAQGMGWNWGKEVEPRENARFSVVYTVAIALAALPILAGVDALSITLIATALTAATLPAAVVPFLVIMNDEHYVGEHTNGWIGNSVVAIVVITSFVLAIVAIPLELVGSGG